MVVLFFIIPVLPTSGRLKITLFIKVFFFVFVFVFFWWC